MTPSAEIRWFFRGTFPTDVKDWFCGSRLCKEEKSRTDHFLVFPGGTHTTVSLRESGLEIKARQGSPEPFVLPGGAAVGRLDTWAGWTHADRATVDHFSQLRFTETGWLSVIGERWLRRFRIDAQGLDEVDPDSRPERGALADLAQLAVDRKRWWTLGFESFGPTQRSDDAVAAATHFLRVLPRSLALGDHVALSCPEWLALVARGPA